MSFKISQHDSALTHWNLTHSMALPYFTTGPAKFDCFTREERGYVGWGMACDSYGAHALDVLKDYQRSVIHLLFHGMITYFFFGNVWKTHDHHLGETGMLVCRRLYIYMTVFYVSCQVAENSESTLWFSNLL